MGTTIWALQPKTHNKIMWKSLVILALALALVQLIEGFRTMQLQDRRKRLNRLQRKLDVENDALVEGDLPDLPGSQDVKPAEDNDTGADDLGGDDLGGDDLGGDDLGGDVLGGDDLGGDD